MANLAKPFMVMFAITAAVLYYFKNLIVRLCSLILGKYYTFVCGTLFKRIKPIELAEKRSRAVEFSWFKCPPKFSSYAVQFKKKTYGGNILKSHFLVKNV